MYWLNLVALVIALIASYLIGSWTKTHMVKTDSSSKKGFGMVESSLLALFAFFLGFTFSISASKIETVRQSNVLESNAIGTALLRTELYGPEVEAKFKSLFKSYIHARIMYFEDDTVKIAEAKKETDNYGNQIWSYANDLHLSGGHVEETRLMIPAINDMLDSTSTRDSAINARLPRSIIWTLYILGFLSCFIVGFSSKQQILTNFIGMIYILVTALTINLILDAGDPRAGFINTKKSNAPIEAIYESLNK